LKSWQKKYKDQQLTDVGITLTNQNLIYRTIVQQIHKIHQLFTHLHFEHTTACIVRLFHMIRLCEQFVRLIFRKSFLHKLSGSKVKSKVNILLLLFIASYQNLDETQSSLSLRERFFTWHVEDSINQVWQVAHNEIRD
jgi:hypothetical protein